MVNDGNTIPNLPVVQTKIARFEFVNYQVYLMFDWGYFPICFPVEVEKGGSRRRRKMVVVMGLVVTVVLESRVRGEKEKVRGEREEFSYVFNFCCFIIFYYRGILVILKNLTEEVNPHPCQGPSVLHFANLLDLFRN
jgi:hypothetical protein